MNKTIATMCVAMLVGVSGCTTYYKVIDPTSGKTYYTTELKRNSGGSATLKDARTGNQVNLQNSEIDEISKEEYETGKVAPEPKTMEQPAPAPGSSNPFK